jgi:hypothetical protein
MGRIGGIYLGGFGKSGLPIVEDRFTGEKT